MADLDDTPPLCPAHGQPMVRGLVEGGMGWRCVCSLGRVTPIPADPARDARVDAYRDRERRRAARALDRWLEATYPLAGGGASAEAIAVAGERFVEAVGDYVLARLAESSDRDVAFGLHQKVVRDGDGVGYVWPAEVGGTVVRSHDEGGVRVVEEFKIGSVHQKADYGVAHQHSWQGGRCVAPGGSRECARCGHADLAEMRCFPGWHVGCDHDPDRTGNTPKGVLAEVPCVTDGELECPNHFGIVHPAADL